MKNSASNPSITQALRKKSAQLLPDLTVVLSDFGYFELSHQRLSQQLINGKNTTQNTIYQGLTRADHVQFKSVMVKWELIPTNVAHLLDDNSAADKPLSHEINILNNLNSNCHNNASLVPALLDSHVLNLHVLNTSYQLTFFAMSYYLNGSLANCLCQNKNLSDKQKYHFILQSARLLANLHHRGWLHNDIKPSNILLENFVPNDADNRKILPRLLLTDFALAQRCDDINHDKLAGTPAYLAPERWQGQGATVQSEVYAFGVMMFEILTDSRPFNISSQKSNQLWNDWAIEHCQKPIPKLSESYRHYQSIIGKSLAKRTANRYQSMTELLADLMQF